MIGDTPDLARLCRLDADQWDDAEVGTARRARIAEHLDDYLQIERDNPKLIWLYSLMLQDGVAVADGEIVAGMKRRVLDEPVLTPMAWRYLANGTARDFQVVLGAQFAEEGPQYRWHALVAWLQVLSGLRRTSPMPEEVQELFFHDGLVVVPERNEVLFRGAWMHFGTLRLILDEAGKRLRTGTLHQFAEAELVEVITWLDTVEPDLDSNQSKTGWKYLARTAAAWKSDNAAMAKYHGLRWDSALPRTQIESWTIEPIVDAWSVRRLAISQHHCADRYIEACVDGTDRIFVILGPEDKIVATLRIVRDGQAWVVRDLKGFANSAVPPSIFSLGAEVVRRYAEATNRSSQAFSDSGASLP